MAVLRWGYEERARFTKWANKNNLNVTAIDNEFICLKVRLMSYNKRHTLSDLLDLKLGHVCAQAANVRLKGYCLFTHWLTGPRCKRRPTPSLQGHLWTTMKAEIKPPDDRMPLGTNWSKRVSSESNGRGRVMGRAVVAVDLGERRGEGGGGGGDHWLEGQGWWDREGTPWMEGAKK